MVIGFRGKVSAKRGLRIGPPQREIVPSLVEDKERSTIGVQLSEQAEHKQRRQEHQTAEAAAVLAKDTPLATCLVTHAQGERHGYLGALSKLMRGSARIRDKSDSKLPTRASREKKNRVAMTTG